jgi:hypothetical protein
VAGERDSRQSTISKPCWTRSGNLPFTIRAEWRASHAESCANACPSHRLDLARASGLLRVIIATIKFKIALETDVWSRPQGFDIVKELAAIGCACNTSDKPGSVCGLSFRLISL